MLKLIEQGYSNLEIAEQLGISLDGAKFHVSEILTKLGVSSRDEAVTAWKDGRRRIPWAWIALGLGAAAAVGALFFVIGLARDLSPRDTPPADVVLPAVSPTVPAFVCPPARTPTPTGRTPIPIPPMDGPASVVFNGRRYRVVLGRAYAGMPRLDPSLVGPKFGEVCFDTSRTWPLEPGDDGNRDGDGFHIDAGTELFSVVGYKTSFRLAAAAAGEYWLFEAFPEEGDLARDILDVTGKVRTVNLYRDEQGIGREELVASTKDPAVIARLVQALLQGKAERPPIDTSMNAFIRIQLVLADGTETTFGFHPDALFLDLYRVPDAFGREVSLLLGE